MPRTVVHNRPKLWFAVQVRLGLPVAPVAAAGAPVAVLVGNVRPAWHLSGVMAGALSLAIPVAGAMMRLRSHRLRKSRERTFGDATMAAAE